MFVVHQFVGCIGEVSLFLKEKISHFGHKSDQSGCIPLKPISQNTNVNLTKADDYHSVEPFKLIPFRL